MNERLRRRSQGAQSQADGARGQSQLIEETEELAASAREVGPGNVAPRAGPNRHDDCGTRRIRCDAPATRGESSQAAGISALDRLREARRGLEDSRSADIERSRAGRL